MMEASTSLLRYSIASNQIDIIKITTVKTMFGKINLGSPKQTTNKNQSKQQPQKSKINPLTRPNKPFKRNQQTNDIQPKNKMIKKQRYKGDFQQKHQQLQGAQFRILNEILYTRKSPDAVDYFKNNPQDFQLYHSGYRHQTSKWTKRPVDSILKYIIKHQQQYADKIIADLGCGEGFLYEVLTKRGFKSQNIKSYDLVSLKPFITSADIAKLPLAEKTVKLCVFCLSLMGTNYLSFIKQAWRVLQDQGQMIISEVESRSPNWFSFQLMVEATGFNLINNGTELGKKTSKDDNKNQYKYKEERYFRTLLFKKVQTKSNKPFKYQNQQYSLKDVSTLLLESCKYKKR